MNLFKYSVFSFIFLNSFSFFGQKVISETAIALNQASLNPTNITRSYLADSAFVKIELNKAQYDINKSNYPYYIISKPTNYNQTATPQLIIKKTQLVTDNHSAVI